MTLPDGQTWWTTAGCVALLALIEASSLTWMGMRLMPGRSGEWYAIWY